MRQFPALFTALVIALTTWSCAHKQQPEASPTAPDILPCVFPHIADFPTIKDSTQFINNLITCFSFDMEQNPAQDQYDKITAFQKINIYGSDKDYFLIEYDWQAGSQASYPWKHQLLLTAEGKLVKALHGERFECVPVFPNQPPFLLVLRVTGKGNGWHELYRITADTLEDVFENSIRTYDAHEDNKLYQPYELKLIVKDYNYDGFNDISFNGKILFIQGLTTDGYWYDSETINGKEVVYSKEHPFKTIPVKYIFLYNIKTAKFEEKEDYATKYDIYN